MYKCIAIDMDGTLLNSKKEISAKTLIAIQEAYKAGKIIVLNTGRGVSELDEFIPILPEVQYVNCLSGALVYDLKNKKSIFSQELNKSLLEQLFTIAHQEDVMIQCLSKDVHFQKGILERLDDFYMGVYYNHFKRCSIEHENLLEEYKQTRFPIHKFNIYHTSLEARERTRKRLQEKKFPIEMVDSETTSLEVSVQGIHKGNGLIKLCEYLNIPLEEWIVIGDADNDIEAFKVAGLAIAMQNANNRVKDICDEIVSDNDHDGVAQAIYNYLLT